MVSPIYSFLKFKMSVAPIHKGTCIAFDEPNIRYSYVCSGSLLLLDNCLGVENTVVGGGFLWNVYPNIRFDQQGKCIERLVAVQEDGVLCCFVSKHNIVMNLVDVQDSYSVNAKTQLLVVDGNVNFEGRVVNKYEMIDERNNGFVVTGNAKAIEITYQE